jgi:hypothetical protein
VKPEIEILKKKTLRFIAASFMKSFRVYMRGPIPRVHMQGFFWYMDGVVVVYSMKTEMEEKRNII